MKKLKVLITFFVTILIIGSSIASAQGKLGIVGKLFTKQDATVLFGKVIGSIDISAKELQKALDKAKDYILVSIKNNQVILRDEKRKSLLSTENVYLDDKDVLYIFSKSQVEQLLTSAIPRVSNDLSKVASTDPVVVVERRAEVLTLTAGEETLELTLQCPPICW